MKAKMQHYDFSTDAKRCRSFWRLILLLLGLMLAPLEAEAYEPMPVPESLANIKKIEIIPDWMIKRQNPRPSSGEKYYWNANVALDAFFFRGARTFRADSIFEYADSIFPSADIKLYTAEYEYIEEHDAPALFLGFAPLSPQIIPKESYGEKCIKESLDLKNLKISAANDTIISIHVFVDYEHIIDYYEEKATYFSSCDSVLITEKGISKNIEDIIFSPNTKLFKAIQKWDMPRIISILKNSIPVNNRYFTLFFSRGIYKNRKLEEYTAYFSLKPVLQLNENGEITGTI